MKIKNSKEFITEKSTDILNSGTYSNHGIKINVGNLILLDTHEKFKLYALKLWIILEESYSSKGGNFAYKNYKDFLNRGHYAKIIINYTDDILACEIYRKVENSFKIVCGGCVQSETGKLALQQIIQDDIIKFDVHYWAEVSDAIEHYFKKYNGFPMPNTLAPEILNINVEKLILSDDGVHYERPIGHNGILYKKMIFGIKNEEVFEKVLTTINNYADFMDNVNNINESKIEYTLKYCIYIIENIYRAHEEDGFNEMPKSWHDELIKCVSVLKSYKRKDDMINDYIRYAEYLLDEMPVLELKKFIMPKFK